MLQFHKQNDFCYQSFFFQLNSIFMSVKLQSDVKDVECKVWYLLIEDCPSQEKKRSKIDFCLVI